MIFVPLLHAHVLSSGGWAQHLSLVRGVKPADLRREAIALSRELSRRCSNSGRTLLSPMGEDPDDRAGE